MIFPPAIVYYGRNRFKKIVSIQAFLICHQYVGHLRYNSTIDFYAVMLAMWLHNVLSYV